MNNPERIFICTSSVPQALKDGVGSYYPNFTGDAAQFDLVAYVPESKVTEEREAAFKVLCSECAEGDVPELVEHTRWYFHGQGNQTVGCSASRLRLKAAMTENRKEEG